MNVGFKYSKKLKTGINGMYTKSGFMNMGLVTKKEEY
jgi:hypothetical protein